MRENDTFLLYIRIQMSWEIKQQKKSVIQTNVCQQSVSMIMEIIML